MGMPAYFTMTYGPRTPPALNIFAFLCRAQTDRIEYASYCIGGDERGQLDIERGNEVSTTGKCVSSRKTCKPLSTSRSGNLGVIAGIKLVVHY